MDEGQRDKSGQRHDDGTDVIGKRMGVEHLHQLGIGGGDGRQLSGAAPEHIARCGAGEAVINAHLQRLDEREGEIVRDIGLPPARRRRRQDQPGEKPEARYEARRRGS